MWSDMYEWHGMMGFGGIWMLLIMVLIVVGLVAVVRWLSRDEPSARGGSRALEILKERYARGEIDRETYQRMKADLEN